MGSDNDWISPNMILACFVFGVILVLLAFAVESIALAISGAALIFCSMDAILSNLGRDSVRKNEDEP